VELLELELLLDSSDIDDWACAHGGIKDIAKAANNKDVL
jgi:hypothetical protein